MNNRSVNLTMIFAAIFLLNGCVAALAPVGVVGAQKSGILAEKEDDLYKIIARQYGTDRSTFTISDIDQQKHWNTTETYFNLTFKDGKKLRCNVSSAFGSNGDMALCNDLSNPASNKCDALSKAANKCH